MKTILMLLCTAFAAVSQAHPPPLNPVGAKSYRDLAYVSGGLARQKLDLFIPEKTTKPVPVVIWIHGGGWQAGSKDQCPPLRSGYVERGYAVASIGYRLSGDAIFPAQIEDCKAAIRWLRAHAGEYGLDGKRFGLWGSSAGGHLVALTGTSAAVKEFEVGENLDQSSRVQAVCDYYGPTDFGAFVTTPGYESHGAPNSPEAKLIGGPVKNHPEKVVRVNPITYVNSDDPPFLIVHGDKDPLVPIQQSELLFEALKKAGVSVHLHTIRNAGHGGPGFTGRDVEEMVAAFFDSRLKGETASFEARRTESSVTPVQENGKAGASAPNQSRSRRGIPWEAVTARQDADKDGKISRGEFSGPKALFDRIDANKDGSLTREEHEAFMAAQGVIRTEDPRKPPVGAPLSK